MKSLKNIRDKFSVGANVSIKYYNYQNNFLSEKLGYIYKTTNEKFYCYSNTPKNKEFVYQYPKKSKVIEFNQNSFTDMTYSGLIVKISISNLK